MEILYQEILQGLYGFLLPLFRITAMLMIAPGIGSKMVPVRLRIGLAVVITSLIFFHLPQQEIIQTHNLAIVVAIFHEIIIGVAIGLVFQLILQMVILGAQVIAMQNGLGFASMVDPQTNSSVPLLSQLYLMLATLLFLALNGHLLMIDTLASSFHSLPISTGGLSMTGIWQLVLAGGSVFSIAIVMALPAIVALLLVNLGFGIMTRAAPQLNIFAVGFPVTLTLGMIVIFITMPGVLLQVESMLKDSLLLVKSILVVR